MASASAPANYTTGNVTIPANSTFWPPIPDDTRRSLQPDIIACACVTWLIAVTFVALRFYTRGKLIHVLGPTDWCIIPALLCAAGVSVSSIEQAVRGAGLHSWQLDLTQFSALERAAWYGIVFYSLSLTFTRISILLLYRRIFTYSWAKRAIRITLILVITLGLWFIASILTACVPLTAFWDWSLFFTTHVYCQPVQIWWLNAALNIVSDIVIMAVPMPVLSTLKLPKRQKIALVGVFGLGFFVCVVSILRLITLVHVEESNPWDSTYTSAQLIFWTAIEVNTAVSCACIMTLKPLIAKVFPRLLSTSQYFRDQSLAWITPISHPRNSRQSFNTRSGISHPHARNQSAMSECASKRGCDLLPRVYEAEGDLEAAQRADSVSTAAYEGEEMSALNAPSKAHLRLSIHVTRSVHVIKTPASPVPDASGGSEHGTPALRSGRPSSTTAGIPRNSNGTDRRSGESESQDSQDWPLERLRTGSSLS